jgi:hypothetical protein
VLLELDIDRLIQLDVHQVQWGTTIADHLEILGVAGVVKAPQLAIVNAESIRPQVQDTFLGRTL